MSEIIGTGWGFPPLFDLNQASVKMVSGIQDVEESMKILLSTTIGERFMMPEYGTDIDRLVFEQLTTTLKTYMADRLRNALVQYEPRIKVETVKIETPEAFEGLVHIVVQYVIRTTNSRRNLVYPFYLKEGTQARIT